MADFTPVSLLDAYNQRGKEIEAKKLADLQQQTVRQGLLAKLQEAQRQKQYQDAVAGLGPNPTQEQLVGIASRFGGPEAVMKAHQGSLDRQATIGAQQEAAKAREAMQRDFAAQRAEQAASQATMLHEWRLTQARNDQERAAETARHNKVMEGINGQLAQIRGSAAAQPKAPTGFRYKADGSGELEPIPGGPKDTAPKDAARAKGAIQKAETVIGAVDEALSQTGRLTTGLPGQVLGMIPGTSAYDLDGTLDTIKANLGFAELQAMRDASPTGGALGQVAIQELQMLQATLASLKRGLSRDKLTSGLQKVRQHMENWKKAVSEGSTGPQDAPAAPAAAQPAPTQPSASQTAVEPLRKKSKSGRPIMSTDGGKTWVYE
jgi:hypothetical protein